MTANLRADEKYISCWSGAGAQYGRWDYRHEDHFLPDMLNDDYFGSLTHLLKPGDWIYIQDAEDMLMTVRVDYADRASHKVTLTRIEKLSTLPVVTLRSDFPDDPGMIYKWRGRAGGGHSIMNARGEVVAIMFPTRELAVQAIAVMYDKKIFTPPPGHEPTRNYVKNAPVAQM